VQLPVLTLGQYNIVFNALSFTIAAMGASFIFFLAARQQVAEKYRPALLVSAIVVAIAGYHYFRISQSWSGAFTLDLDSRVYRPTGNPFNDAYRYVDWLLTVPLLLVEAVAVLALAKDVARGMTARLSFAALLMIALGYPGEVSTEVVPRLIWGTLSTIPFVYIVYVLWAELGKALTTQPPRVQILVRNLRLLLLASWGFYPLAYLLPVFGFGGGPAFVGVQLGYTVADVAAKPVFGLLIYAIARAKTAAEEQAVAAAPAAAPAAAGD
jgi:bacteriorhodopsin